MLSWLYMLQGIGMIAVGAIAIAYWHLKKHIGFKYFLYGAILWSVAIAIKFAMDYTITQPLISILLSIMPIVAFVFIMALYLGLRTGIFESGITYLAIKNTKLSQSNFDEAVALGIGFGGVEAILLGAYALYSTFMLLQSYAIMGLISPISFDQLSLATIPIPIVERASVLVCHVFATVLVVYAVKLKELKWLYISIIFKTMIDGSVIPFKYYVGNMGIYTDWPAELFFMALAIIGLAGLFWIRKKYGGYVPEKSGADNVGIVDPHS